MSLSTIAIVPHIGLPDFYKAVFHWDKYTRCTQYNQTHTTLRTAKRDKTWGTFVKASYPRSLEDIGAYTIIDWVKWYDEHAFAENIFKIRLHTVDVDKKNQTLRSSVHRIYYSQIWTLKYQKFVTSFSSFFSSLFFFLNSTELFCKFYLFISLLGTVLEHVRSALIPFNHSLVPPRVLKNLTPQRWKKNQPLMSHISKILSHSTSEAFEYGRNSSKRNLIGLFSNT